MAYDGLVRPANVKCLFCAPGQYTGSAGTTSCTECASGRQSEVTGSEDVLDCVECIPGTRSTRNVTAVVSTSLSDAAENPAFDGLVESFWECNLENSNGCTWSTKFLNNDTYYITGYTMVNDATWTKCPAAWEVFCDDCLGGPILVDSVVGHVCHDGNQHFFGPQQLLLFACLSNKLACTLHNRARGLA
eukprot:SAG11_NODE_191_length_12943_cov_3.853706_12_plen_189_part_00